MNDAAPTVFIVEDTPLPSAATRRRSALDRIASSEFFDLNPRRMRQR
jgi:hypothetical protein